MKTSLLNREAESRLELFERSLPFEASKQITTIRAHLHVLADLDAGDDRTLIEACIKLNLADLLDAVLSPPTE